MTQEVSNDVIMVAIKYLDNAPMPIEDRKIEPPFTDSERKLIKKLSKKEKK